MGNTLTEGLRTLVSIYDWKVRADADLFMAAADIIDEQHERECHEQYVCGAEHGIGANIDALMIQERGYIELPKDADGIPIHVRDVIKGEATGTYFDVYSIELQDSEDSLCWAIHMFRHDGKGGSYIATDSKFMHHVKPAPTVEDVMVEFATDWESAQDGEDKTAVLKEYAAKLRLANDGEEL